MSKLFDRDKKRGLQALLGSLLFGRGKGGVPLLGLAALVFAVFSMPSGLVGRIPWATKAARKLGLPLAETQDSSALVQDGGLSGLLRRARAGRVFGWNWQKGAESPASAAGVSSNLSSLYLLREGGERPPEAAMPGPRGGEAGHDVIQGGGQSIEGILNLEDAKKRTEGVSVAPEELERGLLRSAYAGVFSSVGYDAHRGFYERPGESGMAGRFGTAGAWKAAGSAVGRGADGAPAFGAGGSSSGLPVTGESGLYGSSALDPGSQLMQNTFNGSLTPPIAGPRGASGGGLSGFQSKSGRTKLGVALGSIHGANASTAFYQLAEGRAVSLAACPQRGSCQAEFAAVTAGATFSGTKVGETGILSAPELGEPVAMPPNIQAIQSSINQAGQAAQDAQKCVEAQALYGPQQQQLLSDYTATSEQIHALNCPYQNCQDFGCVWNGFWQFLGCGLLHVNCAQAKQCKSLAQKMQNQCRDMAQLGRKSSDACPYSAGQGQMMSLKCN